nr:hypothetical protein OG781_18200 [Streptomyces sp. NBC_00830]
MATVENQDLYEYLKLADVADFELDHLNEFDHLRHSGQPPLDSKATCTLLELALFAKRVREESKFKACGSKASAS